MSLGNNILKLRKECGFSQEQLGEKLNVSRQIISNWEIGETSPNSEQLKSLSKEFNVSIDELLDNTFELKKVVLSSNEETTKKIKGMANSIFNSGFSCMVIFIDCIICCNFFSLYNIVGFDNFIMGCF